MLVFTSPPLPRAPAWASRGASSGPIPAPAWSPEGAAPGIRQHHFPERPLRARPCSRGGGGTEVWEPGKN